MSNRSLIEINHELTGEIDRNPYAFTKLLVRYLTLGGAAEADLLKKHYGLKVFGIRHHSDSFTINWGGKEIAE